MTMTLRMFYARAFFALLCVFFLAFLTAFAGVTVAFAADAAPADPEPVQGIVSDWAALVSSSMQAVLMTVLAGASAIFARFHLPAFLTGMVDYLTTTEAAKWEAYTQTALDKARGYAENQLLARFGLTPDKIKDAEQKSAFLGFAMSYLSRFNGDIIAYVDKDRNGVIDLLETHLSPYIGKMKTPPAKASAPAASGTVQ